MEDMPIRGAMLHRLLSNVKIDQLIMNNDGLTALQLAIIANQQEYLLKIYKKDKNNLNLFKKKRN